MRFSSIVIVSLVITGLFLLIPIQQPNPTEQPIFLQPTFISSSDPVNITTEVDFLVVSSSGNGSESAPYIIEDLVILTEDIGIEVQNTQSWFIVRNCTISSESRGFRGIYCFNVSHVAIENCTITNMLDGVFFNHCQFGEVSSSSIHHNQERSIRLEICSDFVISGNQLFQNDGDGIFMTGTNPRTSISHNLIWNNVYHGMFLEAVEDVTLHNNVINNSDFGILFERSENVSLSNNEFNDHTLGGLLFESSQDSLVSDNTFRNCGVQIHGYSLDDWVFTMINNSINGRPLAYYYAINNTDIDASEFGQVILANCHNTTLRNANLFDVDHGVRLGFCTNCTVTECCIYNNSRDGVILQYSFNCKVIDNEIVSNSRAAVYLFVSTVCVVSDNLLSENFDGINFFRSSNCTISRNTITLNGRYGIRLEFWSDYNLIFMNHIAWCEETNAYDECIGNRWDNGTIGNSWDDYDGSGSYIIDGSSESIDHNPSLYQPETSPTTTTTTTSSSITTSSMSDGSSLILLLSVALGLVAVVFLVFIFRNRKFE